MTAATPESRTTTPKPRGRFRFSLRAMLIFVAVMALLACAITPLYKLDQRIGAEYTTAGVIRETTDFVTHQGKWPTGWDDLPNGNRARRYVQMRFDVNVDELIRDPKLIHKTIVPVTGDYHIYPHAERQLNELRDVLIRHHSK